jgi:hypothetical protein
MDTKKAIGASLALALIITSMGMIVAAQDAQSDGAVETGAATDGELDNGTAELRVLITEEQRAALRDAAEQMRAANATHEEIMAEIRTMEMSCIKGNLESYGLTDDQVAEVLDAIDGIDALEQELRDTMEEFRELGVSRAEARNQTLAMVEELRTMHDNLCDLLEQYGIEPPLPPRQGSGWRNREREGPGLDGPRGPEPPMGAGESGGMEPGRPGGHGFEP